MTFLLCLLLKPALLCVSDPRRYWYLAPIAVLTWLLDIFITHTTWPLIAGFPRIGEVTISDTLERLCLDHRNPDRELFVAIAKKINRIDPLHAHIKAVRA
jgi:hypothetical protein